jgi:hypothetical protein
MKEHEHATQKSVGIEPAHDEVAKKAHPGPTHHAHMAADFRQRFWISLVLTVPIQRIDDLVAKMNTAAGMEKMAATANVVTEMVTERRTMRDGMMKMQESMMSHMMEHMQAGTGSMAMCPMMKQMGGMKRE